MSKRGSGRTTEQLRSAPLNSVFVWCGNDLHVPRSIAHEINREDIVVVPRSWILRQENWIGRRFRAIVIDHAAEFTLMEQKTVTRALALCYASFDHSVTEGEENEQ